MSELAKLRAELFEVQQRLAAIEGQKVTSRRDLFRRAGVAAAGGIGGILLAQQKPAGAVDGSLVIGNNNTTTNVGSQRTWLVAASPNFPGNWVFRADAGANTGNTDGVQGQASGAFSGVAGFGGGSNGSGVFGKGGGTHGPGLRGLGSTVAGDPVPGSPVGVAGYGGPGASGVFGKGGVAGEGGVFSGGTNGPGLRATGGSSDFGKAGIEALGGPASTGGTGIEATGGRGESFPGVGIKAFGGDTVDGERGGTAIEATGGKDTFVGGVAGYFTGGESVGGHGGAAIWALGGDGTSSGGDGLRARGGSSENGRGGVGLLIEPGNRTHADREQGSHMYLFPHVQVGPPTDRNGSEGEIWVDRAGDFFIGGHGNWRRLAAVSPRTAGGSVNVLSRPIRVFDSRNNAGAKLPVNSTTPVDATIAPIGGVSVPPGAVAVMGTITVTETVGTGGYLSLYPLGSPPAAGFETSNINWFGPNQNTAASFICGLDSEGRLAIRNGFAPGVSQPTHAIVDIAAYVI